MQRISFLLAGFLLLTTTVDVDWAMKHQRGGNRREHESLLDKQERERNEKDRKKEADDKPEENRNLTCYSCDGDLCRDPFEAADSVPSVQCQHSCWKGVFVSNVRRACGNKRCGLTFQGGSAVSNTCCQTSLCNRLPMNIPSVAAVMLTCPLIIMVNNQLWT